MKYISPDRGGKQKAQPTVGFMLLLFHSDSLLLMQKKLTLSRLTHVTPGHLPKAMDGLAQVLMPHTNTGLVARIV